MNIMPEMAKLLMACF